MLREEILDHANYPRCFCFDGCSCCSTCFPEDSFEGEDRLEGLSALVVFLVVSTTACKSRWIGMHASDSACFE